MRRKLNLRPKAGGIGVIPEIAVTPTVVELQEIISNPRNGFCTSKGVIISCDFSSQELRTSAVLSKDPAMCASYLVPEKLITPEGKEYKNPRADLHTLSAVNCIDPQRFVGTTEDQWEGIARAKLPTDKRSPRDTGKTLNFAMIYLSTAKSISERNHVKLETAESWVKGHRNTYAGYYEWAEEVGRIAAARGYAILPYGYSSQRWVAEERAGGKDGESAERAAVNFMVQGSGAVQTKEAMIALDTEFESYSHLETPPALIGQVHDELIVQAPGRSWIDWDKCKIKDGVVTEIKFSYDEEALHWAQLCQRIMESTQTEMFQRMGSEIKGCAEFAIAPVWAH
jgi:hypothetical protein